MPDDWPRTVRLAKRVFLSYPRADEDAIRRIVPLLEVYGHDVWVAYRELKPGMRRDDEYRKAIGDSDYFVACFSPRYSADSDMNEQLNIAVERVRRMSRERQWFIPVLLEKCALPDHQIGPGETIADSLHYVDFSAHWQEALLQLIRALDSS
ncbi:MAG TPA: toll/interleukin-1 receptor domain-containing protein [Pseudonocardiaceae bacterium]